MSLFGISKEIEFDAGHRVPLHWSKCQNPHGHRYKVVAHLQGELQREGSSTGMVEDFGDLKQEMMTHIHDVLDHGFMLQKDDALLELLTGHGWKLIVMDQVPTAENLAAWCYDQILHDYGPRLLRVEVWETPTSKAVYPL